MTPGSRVFETIDGGSLKGTVIAVLAKTQQVLVRLDAWSRWPDLREQSSNKGYVVFRQASLTEVK
jgi:hypothetical protein